MTRKIVLIVGLPGSGKTTLGEQLLTRALEEGKEGVLIDDPQWGPARSNMMAVLAGIGIATVSSELVIVASPFFCVGELLSVAERFLGRFAHVEKVYFENDPQKAFANSQKRSRNVEASINVFTRSYTPPEGAKVRRIPT